MNIVMILGMLVGYFIIDKIEERKRKDKRAKMRINLRWYMSKEGREYMHKLFDEAGGTHVTKGSIASTIKE